MRKIIFLMALAGANSGIALRAVEPMLPRLATDFDVSVSRAATIITAYAFAYGTAQLLYGPIGDRFGKLRVVTLSLAAAALACFGCALAQGIVSLAAMRLATGLFASTPVMLGMAYIGDHVPIAERQPVIARFVTGTITGQALGPFVGGAVTDLLGWRGTFGLLGAVFALVSAVLWVQGRAQWGEEEPARIGGNPFGVHLRLLSRSRVRYVIAVGFIETFIFFGAYSFLGAWFKTRFGLSLTLIGLLLAGFGVGGVFYTVMVRRLLAQLGQRGLVTGGGALCFAAYLLAVLAPNWLWLGAGTVALGFAFYMLHNTVQTKATEMAPEARATALSLYSSAWALGQASGVAAMGLAVGSLGYPLPIALAGASYFALGLWLRRHLERL